MYEVINSLKSLIGLDAAPTTIVELIVWFTLMMLATAFLTGLIKMIWYTATHTKEIMR